MHKLTRALVLAGFVTVPLTGLAAESEATKPAAPTFGDIMGASGIELSGSVDATYTSLSSSGKFIGGVLNNRVFDFEPNSFNLQAVDLTLSKLPAQGFGGLVNHRFYRVAGPDFFGERGERVRKNGLAAKFLAQLPQNRMVRGRFKKFEFDGAHVELAFKQQILAVEIGRRPKSMAACRQNPRVQSVGISQFVESIGKFLAVAVFHDHRHVGFVDELVVVVVKFRAKNHRLVFIENIFVERHPEFAFVLF